MSVHDSRVKAIGGDERYPQYKGKALLVVNTASRCGYTPQHEAIEEIYQRYKRRGFEILAFPSSDCGGQEPGTNHEIEKFCELRYRTTFQLFAKFSVKGPQAAPLYRCLTTLPENGGEVTWNPNRFLVDPTGKVVAQLDSGVEPTSAEMKERIEATLPRT